jgi:hypothetical protein
MLYSSRTSTKYFNSHTIKIIIVNFCGRRYRYDDYSRGNGHKSIKCPCDPYVALIMLITTTLSAHLLQGSSCIRMYLLNAQFLPKQDSQNTTTLLTHLLQGSSCIRMYLLDAQFLPKQDSQNTTTLLTHLLQRSSCIRMYLLDAQFLPKQDSQNLERLHTPERDES